MGWFENFFGSVPNKELDPEYSATMEKIEQSLEGLPQEEARFLACVALLTARIANVDHEISEGEQKKIHELMMKFFKLPAEQATAVVNIAVASEHSVHVEHHLVTRRMNELASREQKIEVIRMLFHVAAHDDISEAESDGIGSISNSLMLPRSDFLEVRADYREHRKIFKELPKR